MCGDALIFVIIPTRWLPIFADGNSLIIISPLIKKYPQFVSLNTSSIFVTLHSISGKCELYFFK